MHVFIYSRFLWVNQNSLHAKIHMHSFINSPLNWYQLLHTFNIYMYKYIHTRLFFLMKPAKPHIPPPVSDLSRTGSFLSPPWTLATCDTSQVALGRSSGYRPANLPPDGLAPEVSWVVLVNHHERKRLIFWCMYCDRSDRNVLFSSFLLTWWHSI